MLAVKLKDGTEQCFNLKTGFAREQALRDLWASLTVAPENFEKQLKIQTDKGKTIILQVKEIQDIEFEASEYIKLTAANVHKVPRGYEY